MEISTGNGNAEREFHKIHSIRFSAYEVYGREPDKCAV